MKSKLPLLDVSTPSSICRTQRRLRESRISRWMTSQNPRPSDRALYPPPNKCCSSPRPRGSGVRAGPWKFWDVSPRLAFWLLAIIVVLRCYDGHPMPDWPYGITLNALISVLSTVMKATMTFVLTESLAQLKWSWFNAGNRLSDLALLDAASRGAMGAFVVLFRFIPR